MKCTLKNFGGQSKNDYRVRQVVEIECRDGNWEVVLAIALTEDKMMECSQVWEDTGELTELGRYLSVKCRWAFCGPTGQHLSKIGKALRAGLAGMGQEQLLDSLPVDSYSRKRGDISEEQYSDWLRLGESAPSLRTVA